MACLSFLVWPLHSLFRAVVPARLLPGASSFLRALLWPLQAAHPPPSPRPVWVWLLRLSLPYRSPSPLGGANRNAARLRAFAAPQCTFCTCAARMQQQARFPTNASRPGHYSGQRAIPAGRPVAFACRARRSYDDRSWRDAATGAKQQSSVEHFRRHDREGGTTQGKAKRRSAERRVVPDILVPPFFSFPMPVEARARRCLHLPLLWAVAAASRVYAVFCRHLRQCYLRAWMIRRV